MKERPILFKQPHADEMVRAILDGRKTQTRRPVKPQPRNRAIQSSQDGLWYDADCVRPGKLMTPPLGTIGDRLWVRETWGLMAYHDTTDWCRDSICQMTQFDIQEQWLVEHAANWDLPSEYAYWRPSIHMPRWASRITLEITAVRVERVQDITEEDAEAEGIQSVEVGDFYGWKNYQFKTAHPRHGSIITDEEHRIHAYGAPVRSFQSLWQSIYGTWDANTWVWVYEFRRIKP